MRDGIEVRIGTDTMTDWRKTERGCPQGSNFGSLMWNIFQNDLMYNKQTDKCSQKHMLLVQCNDVCR